MKYIIEFVSKYEDCPSRNCRLIFGETDIKGIAEKCFEYGAKGHYSGIRITKEKNTALRGQLSGVL